jgi:rod shape-determining protein MreD
MLPQFLDLIRPNWTLLIILYWMMTSFEKESLFLVSGFCLGVFLDVLYGTWLGVHSLALVIMMYVAIKMMRKVRVYSPIKQSLMIALFILCYHGVIWLIHMFLGQSPNLLSMAWFSVLTSTCLWYWLTSFLNHIRPDAV